jgi:hypothetical protein
MTGNLDSVGNSRPMETLSKSAYEKYSDGKDDKEKFY